MGSIPPELLEQQGIQPTTPPAPDERYGPYEQPHESERVERDEPAPEAADGRRALGAAGQLLV